VRRRLGRALRDPTIHASRRCWVALCLTQPTKLRNNRGRRGSIPRSMHMAKRTQQAASGPSQRMLRVAEIMRHKLAEMLFRGEIHDDVLASHVVTVPEVRMTADLKLATVYVMPLGGEHA